MQIVSTYCWGIVQAVLVCRCTKVFVEYILWCGESRSACSHSCESSDPPEEPPCPLKDAAVNRGGMKNFCSGATTLFRRTEYLCIDLAEKENREIFHMFISRPPRDKQPSLSLSLPLLKAQPVQVIKILPSQGEITLCLVANAHQKRILRSLFAPGSCFFFLHPFEQGVLTHTL